jgi:hypothetical protein
VVALEKKIAPTQILLQSQREISGFIGTLTEHAALSVSGNSFFASTKYFFHKSALIRKKNVF